MKLKKATFSPVVKNADPEFNHSYAQKVTDLISKMSRDEMEVFTTMVVDEVLYDTIEANQRTLQRHVEETALKTIDDIKKSMKTTVLSKGLHDGDSELINSLYELEEIIKDSPYSHGYVFDESDFRRDPTSGRFTKKVVVDRKRPAMDRKVADALGVPDKGGTPHTQSKYQQEYLQVRDFLSSVAAGGNLGDHNVYLQLQNGNGAKYIRQLHGKVDDSWDPADEDVKGVIARPSELNLGGASFGLSNSLGSPIHRNTVGTLNRVDANTGSFASNWTDARTKGSSNERLYARTTAASGFLTSVAPYGSSLQIAGAFGQFVGSHGPDAEKVLGPGIRRAAYRYRGTEKTPDSAMVEEYQRTIRGTERREVLTPDEDADLKRRQNRAVTAAREAKWRQANAGGVGDPRRVTRLTVDEEATFGNREVKREKAFVPIQAVTLDKNERAHVLNDVRARYMAERASQTRPVGIAADRGRDVISSHLAENAPNKDLFALQLDSGNTPPSEGVIIDKEGNIAVQAVGYGDDHYLPFNLKNMKQLRGGEYIRTRSVGGPTSEDIYTGLLMGAKRIQVNSRSGSFIVEFEDDFTGKRRYNDKAKRMVRRYEQILDSVQSEQVDRQSVRPEIRAQFSEEIDTKYPGMRRPEKKKMLQTRIDEYKRDPEMSEEDEVAFERYITGQTQGMEEKRAAAVRSDAWNAWRSDKEFKYRLNGIGYAAALKALQEQFPYYIETYDRPIKDQPERASFEPDKGYIQPGRNRPSQAASGLHGAKHFYKIPKDEEGHSGKQRADNADFQGRGVPAPENTNGEAAPKAKEGETKDGKKVNAVEQELQNVANRENFATVAMKIATKIKGSPGWADTSVRSQFALINRQDRELEERLNTPAGVAEFQQFMEQNKAGLLRVNAINATDILDLDKASGALNRKEYDPVLRYSVGQPVIIHEPPYEKDAPQELIKDELDRVGSGYAAFVKDTQIKNLSVAQVDYELSHLARLKPLADSLASESNFEVVYNGLKNNGGVAVDNPGAIEIFTNPELMDARADALQRVKALNVNRQNKPHSEVVETVMVSSEPQNKELTVGLHKEDLESINNVFQEARDKARRRSQHNKANKYDQYKNMVTSLLESNIVDDVDMKIMNEDKDFMDGYQEAQDFLAEP